GTAVAMLDLHIGPGSFKPVEVEDLVDHPMHAEAYAVSEAAATTINERREAGGRTWAVGTTVVRTLESCADERGAVPAGTGETPVFMPVGTQGTVRALSPGDLKAVGSQLVLANTYHLHVRPGERVVDRLGGLHRFMGWDRPLLTDSGGFQVFSLAGFRRVDDDGVEFQSHVDGGRRHLTPERATEIQWTLGADIAM